MRLSLIGRGCSGKVYAARDRHDGQLYALKQFHPHRSSALSRLESEISILQSLSHPNILALHEVLRARNSASVYLVTDFADCGSLASVLRLRGPLPFPTIRYIFRAVVTGVSYLHSRRIIHQDLKPGNILLAKCGAVWITDFGMSHEFDCGAAAFGTPLYQAPEVLGAAGDCDRGKEDVWALGVTLYEMLFGDVPFHGADVYAIVAAINSRRPAQPRDCDPDAWGLVCKMLAVDPRERCGIEEVAQSEFVQGAPVSARFEGFGEIPVEAIDEAAPMIEVQAVQCPPGSSLLCAEEAGKKGRAHSYPY